MKETLFAINYNTGIFGIGVSKIEITKLASEEKLRERATRILKQNHVELLLEDSVDTLSEWEKEFQEAFIEASIKVNNTFNPFRKREGIKELVSNLKDIAFHMNQDINFLLEAERKVTLEDKERILNNYVETVRYYINLFNK